MIQNGSYEQSPCCKVAIFPINIPTSLGNLDQFTQICRLNFDPWRMGALNWYPDAFELRRFATKILAIDGRLKYFFFSISNAYKIKYNDLGKCMIFQSPPLTYGQEAIILKGWRYSEKVKNN